MPRIVIIGAGACGLACARELDRLGQRDWVLLEQEARPGGLAASVVDPAGFTWDLGGHVVFSHFGEFDALLEEVMDGEVCTHDRSSFIRFADRWVPYPFQNNLRYLPETARTECLEGLATAPGGRPGTDFATWIQTTFGDGIARHFMRPYNEKVWATELAEMSADWIAERVSVVDYPRALKSVREERDDLGWGPNNRFVFPAFGGTGEIYVRLARQLVDRTRYRARVVRIDPVGRRLWLADGSEEHFEAIVSTMPLDRLIGVLDECPSQVREAAAALRHNSVYMVGVGYQAPLADERSWMYFPQADVPFYRVTNFAKYAAANVPGADTARFSSFMTETAHSPERPVDRQSLPERVDHGLRSTGLVGVGAPVVSLHLEEIDYAYPVPTRTRDAALAAIQPWLMQHKVLSRGRFGAWLYELGNMDHAVKMGIDAARHLVQGAPEELWTLRSC